MGANLHAGVGDAEQSRDERRQGNVVEACRQEGGDACHPFQGEDLSTATCLSRCQGKVRGDCTASPNLDSAQDEKCEIGTGVRARDRPCGAEWGTETRSVIASSAWPENARGNQRRGRGLIGTVNLFLPSSRLARPPLAQPAPTACCAHCVA